eukprot:Colp12_sorted_trinity150504_noHs@30205
MSLYLVDSFSDPMVKYGLPLGIMSVVFAFCARSAAMRGTKRTPLPKWVENALRLVFLFFMTSPFIYLHPLVVTALLLVYIPSYLDGTEKNGGRPSKAFQSLGVWNALKRRLNLKLVKTADLDPKYQYIMGLHPHGILPWGALCNVTTDANGFKDLYKGLDFRGLAASFAFYIPIYRDLALALGVCDAARYNARALLDSGRSLWLVPGGATEALYSDLGRNTLVLKKRLGFIRLALETGCSLVPAYSFGETSTYAQVSADHAVVNFIKKEFQKVFGLSLPFICNVLPRPCTVTTVIGAPIHVTKVENPTDKQVDDLLQEYIVQLKKLFDTHKAAALPEQPDAELEIL